MQSSYLLQEFSNSKVICYHCKDKKWLLYELLSNSIVVRYKYNCKDNGHWLTVIHCDNKLKQVDNNKIKNLKEKLPRQTSMKTS